MGRVTKLFGALGLLLTPSMVEAQGIAPSFEQLRVLVQVGDKVEVTVRF